MQRVQYLSLHESVKLRTIPNTYRFRRDRPAKWLQRLCVAVLKRLRCEADEEGLTVVTARVDSDDLALLIHEQIDNIYCRTGYRPKRVLMGNPQFMKLANQVEPLRQVIHMGGGNYYAGLEITVVPWMDGVLVLPEGV